MKPSVQDTILLVSDGQYRRCDYEHDDGDNDEAEKLKQETYE